MPIRPGLFAVICLAVSTPAAFAQTATTTSGQISAYTVDGLALGERVQSNNSGYREYKCSPSDQFDGFTWCQKRRQEKERRRSFNVTNSLLHSRDGKVVYVDRYRARAFFGPNEADEDIQRYSQRVGKSARITKMPPRPGISNGMLATWGKIELEPLDRQSIAALGKRSSSRKGYFVDFIGNFARSAKKGLPIYRVSGGAGFLWVASFDQKGRGTLRIAAVDASAFYREILPTPQADNTRTSAVQQATPEAAPQEADKAAAGAKAPLIFVLLVVVAGIGGFVLAAKALKGPARRTPVEVEVRLSDDSRSRINTLSSDWRADTARPGEQ